MTLDTARVKSSLLNTGAVGPGAQLAIGRPVTVLWVSPKSVASKGRLARPRQSATRWRVSEDGQGVAVATQPVGQDAGVTLVFSPQAIAVLDQAEDLGRTHDVAILSCPGLLADQVMVRQETGWCVQHGEGSYQPLEGFLEQHKRD